MHHGDHEHKKSLPPKASAAASRQDDDVFTVHFHDFADDAKSEPFPLRLKLNDDAKMAYIFENNTLGLDIGNVFRNEDLIPHRLDDYYIACFLHKQMPNEDSIQTGIELMLSGDNSALRVQYMVTIVQSKFADQPAMAEQVQAAVTAAHSDNFDPIKSLYAIALDPTAVVAADAEEEPVANPALQQIDALIAAKKFEEATRRCLQLLQTDAALDVRDKTNDALVTQLANSVILLHQAQANPTLLEAIITYTHRYMRERPKQDYCKPLNIALTKIVTLLGRYDKLETYEINDRYEEADYNEIGQFLALYIQKFPNEFQKLPEALQDFIKRYQEELSKTATSAASPTLSGAVDANATASQQHGSGSVEASGATPTAVAAPPNPVATAARSTALATFSFLAPAAEHKNVANPMEVFAAYVKIGDYVNALALAKTMVTTDNPMSKFENDLDNCYRFAVKTYHTFLRQGDYFSALSMEKQVVQPGDDRIRQADFNNAIMRTMLAKMRDLPHHPLHYVQFINFAIAHGELNQNTQKAIDTAVADLRIPVIMANHYLAIATQLTTPETADMAKYCLGKVKELQPNRTQEINTLLAQFGGASVSALSASS